MYEVLQLARSVGCLIPASRYGRTVRLPRRQGRQLDLQEDQV